MLNKSIKFLIENKLVAVLLLVLFVGWGTVNAPFNWDTGFLPSNPVAVDAIPDIGENQQIVFTKWDGRSPQDIEDQITYPLTTSLLGIPGVKTIRSSSMFGFSSIYIILRPCHFSSFWIAVQFNHSYASAWLFSMFKKNVLCTAKIFRFNPCWP